MGAVNLKFWRLWGRCASGSRSPKAPANLPGSVRLRQRTLHDSCFATVTDDQ